MPITEAENEDRPTAIGRPRDQAVDGRVYDAAIALYAREGWGGFTFEAVARASGVGKGALYRRWDGRAALLSATLDARWQGVAEIDTGTLRGDLLALVRFMFRLLADSHGGVAINMQIDARRFAEVRDLAKPFQTRLLERLRLITTRAVTRGELAPETSLRLLTDILVGAVTNHVLATPPALHEALLAQEMLFALSLVDLLMTGIERGRP